MGGSVEKQIQKALGFLPPCGNGCRFSESAICSSRGHPPSKIKLEFKIQNTKVAPAKVAFDTVQTVDDLKNQSRERKSHY